MQVRALRRRRHRAPPRGQCYNFQQDGACDYGDRCRFLHGEDDDRFEKRAAERAERAARGEADKPKRKARKSRGARPRQPREKLEEDCQNYLEGRCYYGETCRRRHVGEVELQPVEKIDEVCNNFQQGRCRFGEFCRRQHVDAPAEADEEEQ